MIGGSSFLYSINSVYWSNSPDQIYASDASTTEIKFSDIEGGWAGFGNIDLNPLFIGGDPFDYHFSFNSPCIDAGTDNGAPSTDLDGNPRPQGGAIDMGTYEYQSWPSIIRAYVNMPSHNFAPNNPASCTVSLWNPTDQVLSGHHLFAILDVHGNYFYAPSFSSFDYFTANFPVGLTKIIIIPEFTWPSGVGSASGLVWYAALTNPEMTSLASEIGVFDFGWSE